MTNATPRNHLGAARGPFVCQCCGVSYVTHRQKGEGEKYCSRDCAYSARAKTPFSPVAFNACIACGKRWTAKRAKSVCSLECERQRMRAASLARDMAERANARHTCKECGVLFVPDYASKRRVFCSHQCQRKTHNRNKPKGNNATRAKRAGNAYSYFNELRIFRRDRWKCQLCGVATPEAKRGTYDDDAPELDHVVSIADGGGHVPENVQCACRRCNADKGAASRGQLWLAGFADMPAARVMV